MSDDTLETERLILVRPTMQHLAAYTAFCASDRARFVGGPFDAAKAYEKLCAMAGHWNLRGFGRYVITHRQTGEALGHVGALQIDDIDPPEMTWTLWQDVAVGKGYAFEAAQAYLAQVARATGADELIIRINRNNVRSHQLAARLAATVVPDAAAPHWMPDAVTYRIRTGSRVGVSAQSAW